MESSYVLKESRLQKVTRVVLVVLLVLAVLFQLFQSSMFFLLYPFLHGYATAILIFALLYVAALVFTCMKRRKAFCCGASLLLTAVSSIGLAAAGFMLTHPVTDTEDYYISGVPESAFWKYFAPMLLLIVPAAILFVAELRRVRKEEELTPYEKQFD